jgi:hypothetical protein
MSITSILQQQLAHQRRFMTAEQIAFLSSSDAAAAAAAAEDDPHASAVVILETLKGIALDPLRGSKPEHFMIDHGDYSTFWLMFDRLTHFVPMFDLPKDDPVHQEVTQAIEANLGSRMFKAAALNRRAYARLGRLETRNVRKWHRIHDEHIQQHMRPDTYGQRRDEVLAQAAAKATAATQARDDQLRRRSRAISDAAAPSLMGKSWSEWAIDRLVASLPALVPAAA